MSCFHINHIADLPQSHTVLSKSGVQLFIRSLLSNTSLIVYKTRVSAAHSVNALVWVCFHVYRIYIICIIKEMTHERETILTRCLQ